MDQKVSQERARQAVISRDFPLAIRLYRGALAQDKDNTQLWLDLGMCYEKAGEYSKAIQPFGEVLRREPYNAQAVNELGQVFRRLGDYEKSVAILEKGLMTITPKTQINYNLGYTYKLMGKYDAAEQCFLDVLLDNPNDVLAVNHLGSIQALRGNHLAALDYYRRGLCVDSNHPVLHLNAAYSYKALGRTDEALKEFENALRSQPGWPEAMQNYAELLLATKDLSKADRLLDEAIKIHPQSSSLHTSRGKLEEKQGRYLEAESSYLTSHNLDKSNIEPLDALENLYEKQGRSAEAEEKINQMKNLVPDDTELEFRHTKLLIDQNRLDEAGEKLRELYRDNVNNTRYLNLLAQYFVRGGRQGKANGCYKRIAELDPGNITYMRDSAWQYLLNKQYEEAESHLKRYIERNPTDSTALSLLGEVYDKEGRKEEAVDLWKEALKYDENNPIIIANITRVGKQLSDMAEMNVKVTDILSRQASEGDAASIEQSLAMYETMVQNRALEKAAPDSVLDDAVLKEIESLEEIDYNKLLQFEGEPDAGLGIGDSFGDLVLPESTDADLPLDGGDSGYPAPLGLGSDFDRSLEGTDMPVEYSPNRDGGFPFDPYPQGSRSRYPPKEKDEFMDVEPSWGSDDTGDDLEIVPPQEPDAPQDPPLPEPGNPSAGPQPAWKPAEAPEHEKPDTTAVLPDAWEPEPAAPQPPDVEPVPAPGTLPAQEDPLEQPLDLVPEVDEELVLSPDLDDGFEPDAVQEDPLDLDLPHAAMPEMEPPQGGLEEVLEPGVSPEAAVDPVPGLPEEPVPTVEDLLAEPIEEGAEDEIPLPTLEELMAESERAAAAGLDNVLEPAAPETPPVEGSAVPAAEAPETVDFTDEELSEMESKHPNPVKRTMETVGNVLQRVFVSVERPSFPTTAAMFTDLRDLCGWLPPDKQEVFRKSMNRLKLDYVISRLDGRPGLLAAASAIRETGGIPATSPGAPKPSLLKTMEYMRGLMQNLPDKDQASLLTGEVTRVIDGISQNGG